MDFGDRFYLGKKFAPPNGPMTGTSDEDLFPYLDENTGNWNKLPDDVYEVSIKAPMGVVFEENKPGLSAGLYVAEIVEDMNAAKSGELFVGDKLIACTAIKVMGAKWERFLVDTTKLDFETCMSALQSNKAQFGAKDIIMHVKREPVAAASASAP